MKFLICIGGVEPSADTIRFGARIAKAFEANLSVLYVQPRLPHAVRPEIGLTREKLSEWEIEIPGVKVLRAARALLVEQGFVKTGPSGACARGTSSPRSTKKSNRTSMIWSSSAPARSATC